MKTKVTSFVSLVATLIAFVASAQQSPSALVRIYTVGDAFGQGVLVNRGEKPANAWTRTGWDLTVQIAAKFQTLTGAPKQSEKELRVIADIANVTIGYTSASNTGKCLYEGVSESEFGCLRALVPKYRDVVIGTLAYDKDASSYLLVLRRLRTDKQLDDVYEITITDADTDVIGLVVAADGAAEHYVQEMTRNADLTIINPNKAAILVDDKITTQTLLRVSAGKHVVRATHEGFEPWSATIECKVATPCSTLIALKSKETIFAKQEERRPSDPENDLPRDPFEENGHAPSDISGLRVALISSGWAVFATGAGLVIAGVSYNLDASHAQAKIDEACVNNICSLPEPDIRTLYADGVSAQDKSNTLLGIGIGFAVAGLATAITGHVLHDGPSIHTEVMAPVWNGFQTNVGPDGFFVSTGLTF